MGGPAIQKKIFVTGHLIKCGGSCLHLIQFTNRPSAEDMRLLRSRVDSVPLACEDASEDDCMMPQEMIYRVY